MTNIETLEHWKDGKPWRGVSDRRASISDPATGQITTDVLLASTEDVDAVVRSSRAAFELWRQVPLGRRASILFRFRQLVADHADELAAIITAEHGKVLSDAAGEVQRGLEVIDFACGVPTHVQGASSLNVSTDIDSHSLRQPVGVVAGITPFNFPVMVPMWMHPVAIACGNAFILKPSERDPSVSNRVAELWSEAGLPEGVFNVVHGDRDSVDALLHHADVDAVSFVGSTPVARHIYATGSAHGKRVQALGGAKNHMVVLPDADLEGAANAAVGAAYGSAGERCMAISVVVAVGEVADDLVESMRQRVEDLRVGPGTEPDSEMGPLITGEHRDRVSRLVDRGIEEGAVAVVDRRDTSVEGQSEGFWLGPCLLDQVTPDMEAYREEIFGPVLSVIRVDDASQALDVVNANPYGNGAAIFTRSGAAARWFQSEVTAGMVGVNVPIPVPMAYFSFGGWKDSAFGSHHVHGPEGVGFYTRNKTITTRWPKTDPSGPDFHFPGER